MTYQVFEHLLSSATMLSGEQSLLAMKDEAIPLLRDLLDGTAKNANGVAYRDLGLPLRCALEVAIRLGPIAKPLESLLVMELRAGSAVAATALGGLAQASKETFEVLAATLAAPAATRQDINLPFEAAMALVRLGALEDPSVRQLLETSKRAEAILAKVRRRVATQGGVSVGEAPFS